MFVVEDNDLKVDLLLKGFFHFFQNNTPISWFYKKSDGTSSVGHHIYNNNPFRGTWRSGRWFYWSSVYQQVLEDLVFPNKMTHRTAWHRYNLLDHELGVCPLTFLTTLDMIKQSNGRRNLSNLKILSSIWLMMQRDLLLCG